MLMVGDNGDNPLGEPACIVNICTVCPNKYVQALSQQDSGEAGHTVGSKKKNRLP